jgi:site-specific DNA-methyltransferase (adenine-specific)
MKSEVFNEDCMIGMSRYPDKYFELAIVDPPYGIGWDNEKPSMTISKNMDKKRLASWNNRKLKNYKNGEWDSKPPTKEYFDELFRVSQNQIIWGANHFTDILPQSSGWIFWDKLMDKGFSLSDGEMAWTSFNKGVKKLTVLWAGYKKGEPCNRIHPTQKPVALYKWLLTNYAKAGDKILDTHGGSMSSVIACIDLGFDITCFELDTDYFNSAKKRIETHMNQLNVFKEPTAKVIETPETFF